MKRTIVNPIYKDTVTFIKTAAETGGAYTLLELTLLPGGRNPPHIHKAFTEKFTAIEGTLGLHLKGGSKVLHPGESYIVKANEVHNFFNPSEEEIKFQVLFTPGHQGIENALCIAYGLAADGLSDKKGSPKNFSVAALMMEMSDSYPKGLLSLLIPFLSMVAKRARKKGLEKILIDQYCQPLKEVNRVHKLKEQLIK